MRRKYMIPRAFCIVIALVFFLFQNSCRSVTDPADSITYEAVYVDSLIVADTVSAGIPVVVRIKGGLPDPSWTFDHFDIRTDYSTVYVQPIGKKNPSTGPVPQVIIPYDEAFKFTFFRTGQRTIMAIGRVNTLIKRITIEM